MSTIKVEHHPEQALLDAQGVSSWPIWEKEASSFPWHYDSTEHCYLLEGDVVVTPEGGEPVHIQAGDFVSFPAGMSCLWEIRQAVRKHYRFD